MREVPHKRPTRRTCGSSGSGEESRAWIESSAVLSVRAGLHWSFRMSRQMAPFWLLTFGCLHMAGEARHQLRMLWPRSYGRGRRLLGRRCGARCGERNRR